MSSSSSAPCAACKVQRRKCIQECIFAPYFPPDHPEKFVKVHKVFGASNVAKILNELPACHREDAVNSLAFEADARLRDPIYGCVGLISLLQHRLKQVKTDLDNARMELAHYIGPAAMLPIFHPAGLLHGGQYPVANNPSSPAAAALIPYNNMVAAAAAATATATETPAINVGFPTGGPHAGGQQWPLRDDPKVHQPHHLHHQINNQQLPLLETQQSMVFREEQEMIRAFERQQQQHQLLLQQPQHQQHQPILRLNDEVVYEVGGVVAGSRSFNEYLTCSSADQEAVSPTSLALGAGFDDHYQIHHEQPDDEQHHDTLLLLQQPSICNNQQPHTADDQVVGRLSFQHQPQQTTLMRYDADHDQHLGDRKPEEQSGSNDGGTLGCRSC